MLCATYFFIGSFIYGVAKLIEEKSAFVNAIICTIFLSAVPVLIIFYSDLPQTLVLSATFSAIIVSCYLLEIKFGSGPLRHFEWFGNCSFGNYLWHTPLQLMFLLLVSFQLIKIDIIFSAYFIFGYIAVVILVSSISHSFIEKPLQRFFNSFA